jgi:hypothetical protein
MRRAEPTRRALADSVAAVGVEKHVCRGLNACKDQGAKGGERLCGAGGRARRSSLIPAADKTNAKGRVGVEKWGLRTTAKEKGGCHVPLMDDAWDKARKIFEAKMKKSGKEFGAAPAEVKS